MKPKAPKGLGRCGGAFRVGRLASFGRVVCLACGARLRPLSGSRVPNHVEARPSQKEPPKEPPGSS